jgi:protein subunit release factor A
VSVINETKVRKLQIRDSDFEVRFHRGTGKGGQRKNKVATCCVVKHIPSGMTQKADGRSRIDNEEEAKRNLIERLELEFNSAHSMVINEVRCNQLQEDRNRLYRFQNDEVIDYRSGKTMSLKHFMRGQLEKLW